MIDIMINGEKDDFHLNAVGTNTEVCADLFLAIRILYTQMKKNSEACAEEFKQTILSDIEAAFMSAEEMHESIKEMEKAKEEAERIRDILRSDWE